MKKRIILPTMLLASIFTCSQIIYSSAEDTTGNVSRNTAFDQEQRLWPDLTRNIFNQFYPGYLLMQNNWASAATPPTFQQYVHQNNSTAAANATPALKFNDQATKALSDAILKKNIANASKAISDGANVNQTYNFGYTLLYEAVYRKSLEIVKLLLDNGAQQSINQANDLGQTPLSEAAVNNDLKMVQLLLDNGAQQSINQNSNLGYTSLYEAVRTDSLEAVKLLLANGAQQSINQATIGNNTPLELAVGKGHPDIVQEILNTNEPDLSLIEKILDQLQNNPNHYRNLKEPNRSAIIEMLAEYINPGLK